MGDAEEVRLLRSGHGRSTVSVRDGVREALPIVFGYVPIGMAYGVLGTAAGLPVWALVAMSVLVYAGSAQFLAVSLLGAGASGVVVVSTTLLANLRHVLYGSALSPLLAPISRGRLAWVAAQLTDESFVMASRAAGGRREVLTFPFIAGLQATAQLSWIGGSLLGGLAGSYVGDPTRLGLDFALVAMFIGLLALQVHGRRELAIALVAGTVSVLLKWATLGTLGVVVGTLAASAVGLLFAVPPGGRSPDAPAADDGGMP